MLHPIVPAATGKASIIGLVAALLLLSGVAVAQQVGLAERRAMATYRKMNFPAQEKAIQSAAAFAVPVEVKWDTLTLAGQADNVQETWYLTDVYFTPLVEALTKITVDDMGKSALKAKLTRIVIHHDPATAPASNHAAGLRLEGGVLTLNYQPGANGSPDQVEPRAKAIQDFLESNLQPDARQGTGLGCSAWGKESPPERRECVGRKRTVEGRSFFSINPNRIDITQAGSFLQSSGGIVSAVHVALAAPTSPLKEKRRRCRIDITPPYA